MTREHAQALLPIITAYAEGKTIQIDDINTGWTDMVTAPSFTQAAKNYRIKPELDPDPFAKLREAHAEGEVIQAFNHAIKEWVDLINPSWTLHVKDYRIKPTPKLVPMTSYDLPPMVWVRRKDTTQIHLLVYRCDTDTGCLTVVGASIYPSNVDEWQWSPDRKTWNSFMKEVEA